MRAHNQSAIAAWVREAGYPAADRLAIICPTEEHDEWLAMLDGRYLQVLRRPQTTRLLLEAYGVKHCGGARFRTPRKSGPCARKSIVSDSIYAPARGPRANGRST